MSFILDALKKIEQRKQQGPVPDLMTVHPSIPREEKKRPIWPYIILIALLLNAGILAAWLRPWEVEDKKEIAANSITVTEQKSSAVESDEKMPVSDSEESIPPPVISSSEKNEIKEQEPVKETIASPRLNFSTRELEDLKEQIKIEQLRSDDASPPDTESEGDDVSEPLNNVLEYSQLPESIRDALPEIKIKAHIYSNNPGSRIANVNGNITREGESVTNGLRIEEITTNSIIFDYQGYLFRKRAF